MVVGSAVVSPLCTWIVAACMSMSTESKNFNKSPNLFHSQKKLRRKGGDMVALSSKNGGFNRLMKFCHIEPCEEYYTSQSFSFSCALFGESAFAVLGSKNRGRKLLIRAHHSGIFLPEFLI